MKVAIHAGAAFTDDGRLLRSLQANREALAQNSVAFFGRRRYRQLFQPTFHVLNTRPPLPDEIETLRSSLSWGPEIKRAVFTNEGFVGDPDTRLSEGQFYPLAGKRMSVLQEAFGENRVELFMALRNPGSFIPKHLMSLPEDTRNETIRKNDLSHLSWVEMIEDIRDFAPKVKITLWCNEDTPFIWGDVMRYVGGLPDAVQIIGEYDLLISLLTDDGQEQAKALLDQDTAQSRAELRYALAQILEDHAQPDKIEEELDLPGWSSEVIDAFSELYEQDVATLEAMDGVRVLKP
ncbi:hypothetical protein [Ruegeria sp. R14_0]|uniref:hypothetical protein n=1 Tax=Ruegeria sp. R14_0 TaxID=2821100 RepID=UPI001ADBA830|nr:hypothetical protein [Ruegeria sp. R14_0]MBO9444452.1 hypothetical protein [Ruegeria sp. R14_0]